MGYTTDFEGKVYITKKLDDNAEPQAKKRKTDLPCACTKHANLIEPVELDPDTAEIITKLSTTRRMRRCLKRIAAKHNISEQQALEKYGIDGELYFVRATPNEEVHFGQNDETDTLSLDYQASYGGTPYYENSNMLLRPDYNTTPRTQPSLWCQWLYNEEECCLQWDGGEKFYNYRDWMQYLLDRVLVPKGYELHGTITYQGEESDDVGLLIACGSKVQQFAKREGKVSKNA